jgi:predicted house-cleaning noncanonical NTP pyrophosphatase (MazG superfamily)
MQKLVRDKILEKIENSGGKPRYRRLKNQELIDKLISKLYEEVLELKETDRNQVEELKNEIADVEEIVSYLIKTLKITRIELKQKQKEKVEEVGGFKKKIFVETVSFNDANTKWIEYYRKKGWKEEKE